MSDLTYRQALPEEAEQVLALLESSGLYWPGDAATPYVAVSGEGRVVGVMFKTVCFHAEPFCAVSGAGVSVTELGKVIVASFRELANELDRPVTLYTSVQDNPIALAAAQKSGMESMPGYVMHSLTIYPDIPEEPEPVIRESASIQ
jgi:hypothetical protein